MPQRSVQLAVAVAAVVVIAITVVATGFTRAAAAAAGSAPQSAALSQYEDADGFYADTTGAVGGSYTLSSVLGFLAPTQVSGTVALYSCEDSSDTDVTYLSLSDCSGQTAIGVLGYIYTSAPSGQASVPLYACSDGPAVQFASTSAACTGGTEQNQLGYLLESQTLIRYSSGDHWVTTGTPPSGYTVEGGLGWLVDSANGTTPLYGCQEGAAQFLSLDSTCDGGQGTQLGVEGYVYGATSDTTQSTRELYACNQNSDYFEATDGCEGQTSDGTLGYILAEPLPAPATTTTTTTTTTTATTTTAAPTTGGATTTGPAPTTPPQHHGTHAKPQIRVQLLESWTWDGSRDRFYGVTFKPALPKHSIVAVTCQGKRCPRNLGTTGRATRAEKHLTFAQLIARMKADTWHAGQLVTFTIAHAGDRSERSSVKLLRNRKPEIPKRQQSRRAS